MSSLRVLFAVVVAGLLVVGGGLIAQDGKKGGETPAKLRGQLPPNWLKLGLTDKQKQTTYSIQAKYDKEIEALSAQIRELRQKERSELDNVLSADQKKRLREILDEKTPGTGTGSGDVKKPS